MKRILLTSIILLLSTSFYAISIEDRYVMRVVNDGQLYFILPYEIPSSAYRTKAAMADITYLTTTDSVTMNVSVWGKDVLKADSILLITEDDRVVCDFQTFFIEMDGKLWLHRYSLRYPYADLCRLYSSPSPFILRIYAESKEVQYTYLAKAWKKESVWMNQILQMIMSNKEVYNQVK